MRLFQSIGPNPRVTTMFIAEKGIAVERAFVDILKGENRQADYLARNPVGGTPCLELDDGGHIAESVVICEYLEELHPTPALIGSTAEERAATRAMLRSIDQTIVVPMTAGFRGAEGLPMFKDRMLCVAEGAEGNKATAREGLGRIDALLATREFICGDAITLADILLFCFTDFGSQVGQPIPEGMSNLSAWHARIAARPSAATSANPQNGL